MTKKIKLTIAATILFSALLISGCDLLAGSTFTRADYRVGNEGLTLIMEGNRDIRILQGEEFATGDVTIHFQNRGATNLQNDDIYVRITTPGDFIQPQTETIITELEQFSDTSSETLYGKSEQTRQGDIASHNIVFNAYAPLQGASSTIDIEACYRYKTILQVPSLCLRTDSRADSRACRTQHTFTRGQGAPIRISNIEIAERRMGEDITHELLITVTNAQGGIATIPHDDSFKEACLAKQNINMIHLETVTVGTQELTCNVENQLIDLREKERTIRCNVPRLETSEGTIQVPLYVELSYGYHTKAQHQVNIQRR